MNLYVHCLERPVDWPHAHLWGIPASFSPKVTKGSRNLHEGGERRGLHVASGSVGQCAAFSGTLNMLKAGRLNGVKKFVYASSSLVYGDEPNLPRIDGREGQAVVSPMR